MNDLKSYARENHVPIIRDGGLEFLLKTVKEGGYHNILELGTAIGYSAINMAQISDDIQIDTIERNPEMYAQAVQNVKEANLEGQIHLHFGEIKEFVPTKTYDFIFVDAAKGQYYNYLNQFIDYLEPKGRMFFDNMAFHGMVEHPELTNNRNTRQLVKKIKNFRDMVQDDERFDIILYENVGDGILILNRRMDYEI